MKIVDAIDFPILCFTQGIVFAKYNLESLSTCTTAALRYGYFDRMWFVDSSYSKFRVKSAGKLYGVGPFWGYDIFLNRRIRVQLTWETESHKLPLEEIKQSIFKSFKNWHGWASADGFDELQLSVKNAHTLLEIINSIDQTTHKRS
jgi:hypothetical protein